MVERLKNEVCSWQILGWPPGAPRGGQSLGRVPMGKKSMLSPGTVCRFPSNFVGEIPRGLEPEVVHMGHVAPGGPRGRAPRVNNVAKFNLLVHIQ